MGEAPSTVVSDREIADTLRVVLRDVRQGIRECEDPPHEHPCRAALSELDAAESALLALTARVEERRKLINVEGLRCTATSTAGDRCVRPSDHAGSHMAPGQMWTDPPDGPRPASSTVAT